MPYREISFTAISSVDDTGIQFTNGEKILFEDCLAARREQVGNGYDGVGVADRDIIADPPYIEFYSLGTEPPLRVVFDKRGLFSKSKNNKQFHELQFAIERAGYATFDLS